MKDKTATNLALIGLGVCAVALAGSVLIGSAADVYYPERGFGRWWIDPETGRRVWVE